MRHARRADAGPAAGWRGVHRDADALRAAGLPVWHAGRYGFDDARGHGAFDGAEVMALIEALRERSTAIERAWRGPRLPTGWRRRCARR
ncbi:MAG: hypothetical protein R3F65_31010 [bacterium]